MATTLGIPGFSFDDLHDARRLADLTRAFDERLQTADAALYARYHAHRGGTATLTGTLESDLLVELSGQVSSFLGTLFRVNQEQANLREGAGRDAPIFKVKREFIQRRVFKKGAANRPAISEAGSLEAQAEPLFAAAARVSSDGEDHELIVALVIETLLDAERTLSMHFDPARPAPLDAAVFEKFCKLMIAFGETRSGAASGDDLALTRRLLDLFDRWSFIAARARPRWPLFKLPQTLDFANLVPLKRAGFAITGHEEHQRKRDGFGLTDLRKTPREVQSEIHYCLFCHDREKDSCSSGLPEKGSNHYKKNPLGIPLTGCPLEERISEMHLVAREGDMVAALALVCIDNPMAPGTGHRICNDCMKACIYQKQDPVDIPQIETRVLSDTLRMRWGYEIWSLLTRWNPLNMKRQHPREYTGVNVLVVGMGPAGYTLAHHLLNEGFGVVGIDGLKIEPIQTSLTPIEFYDARFGKPLDQRITSGFGGVSEYGITVRWDKSFLDVLHLNLVRRPHFRLYGGTRFGGTIPVDEAFDRYGFDHVALATGAGKPTVIPLKNNLIRGVRKASDFLMSLQLSGAYKANALANLQVRLPAVVIGGGLTAIDTATELAAYYPIQVEKLLARHEILCAASGEELVFSLLDAEERHVYAELLEHGRAIRAEREKGTCDFARLVQSWGGVTIAYRKGLIDSPAYRLNHEEVLKCLEEGIVFAEGLSPVEVVPDAAGAVQAVRFSRKDGTEVTLDARTVCVAAGTSPNITVEKEAPGLFEIDPEHHAFRSFRGDRTAGEVTDDLSGRAGFFTSYAKHGRHISFFGDNNPEYAGSVVKAMASAKDGYPQIVELFKDRLAPAPLQRWSDLTATLDDELNATVHEVKRLTPTIVEVVVRAKAAARGFLPGQFYRLQNYESLCDEVSGTRLLMEGLALTGAWVDREQGLLSMIVLEMGTSSRLCAALKPGEPVVVMGPTGAPSTIPRGEDVALCGGGLGNAVLFSISRALRQNGCRVVYFAGYRHAQDVFKRDEIEESTDVVVWSVDKGSTPPEPRRAQDKVFSGNMVEAMVAYASGALGAQPVPLTNVRRIIAIGSDRMMAAVTRARHAELKGFLPAEHVGIASVNSPMQCMMKEICAQCLQKHRNPLTGKESVVFTCFEQDQPMDRIDWDNLRARLRSNSLQEKLSAMWLEKLLAKTTLRRI